MASLLAFAGCKQKAQPVQERQESREAKALLQGIWIDADSEDIVFKAHGDTIYYPDSLSQPTYFRIVDDTLVMGASDVKYPIVKQSANLFWFQNPNGDVVKLARSTDSTYVVAFGQQRPHAPIITEKLNRDTVVMVNGERYHCYVAINPTRYKVVRTSFTDDGVAVDNVYYDNIIHVSVYHGTARLFSRDFRKEQYAAYVPKGFLSQAILSNMEFDKADADGFRFNASLCIPDEASCYLIGNCVSLNGRLDIALLEY